MDVAKLEKWTDAPVLARNTPYAIPARGRVLALRFSPQLPVTPGDGGKAPKVTKDVFRGYALYNSYCYRCHGTDATGGQLGPDLRASLVSWMKPRNFMSIAMAGRQEKGMPSWAGFLSQEDMIKIYRYVKGRSLDLVPSGRPPSEQD